MARAATWLGLATAVALGVPGAALAADPPDPGSTHTSSFAVGSETYPYIVYVPTTYDPARPAPLVVMTHGCQTTADQQMRANLYNRVAERERFVVLYPDVNATEAQSPGPTQRCWQFPAPTSWHRDSGDPAAIAGMTRTVIAHWNIDPERVYMVGMSAGSFMTSIMAAAYPDLFAAVAINAGGAYADGGCLVASPGIPVQASAQLAYAEMGPRARVVPRLVTGGDADQGIPPACADKALEQGLRTNNLVISGTQEGPIALTPSDVHEEPNPGGYASTVRTYRDPDGCVAGQRWLIHGMNHFWPGGSSDPALANFTDPKGPNGAEVTWGFLSHYTRSETAPPCAESLLHAGSASTPSFATALSVPRLASDAGTRPAVDVGVSWGPGMFHGELDVQRSPGSGAWQAVDHVLAAGTRRLNLVYGATYRLRARSVAPGGTTGPYVPATTVVPLDDIRGLGHPLFTPGWRSVRSGPAYGGSFKRSWHAGDGMVARFRGSRVYLIGRRGPFGGRAIVSVDGVRAYLNLYSRRPVNRSVIFTRATNPRTPHRIALVTLPALRGHALRHRVEVDGLGALR